MSPLQRYQAKKPIHPMRKPQGSQQPMAPQGPMPSQQGMPSQQPNMPPQPGMQPMPSQQPMQGQGTMGHYAGHMSDADFLDENVYAPSQGMPDETDPMGLMDRLYREQLTGKPMVRPPNGGMGQNRMQNQSVPTTKNNMR